MRELVVNDDYIELKGFEELNEIKELSFAVLSNGLVIKEGNDNNETHFCVENDNGIIKNKLLIEKIKNKKFPQKITFAKISDRYLSEI
jgi:hypothetical protein